MPALPEDPAGESDRDRPADHAPDGPKPPPFDFGDEVNWLRHIVPDPEPEPEVDLTVSSFMTEAMLSDFGHEDSSISPATSEHADDGIDPADSPESEEPPIDFDLDAPR